VPVDVGGFTSFEKKLFAIKNDFLTRNSSFLGAFAKLRKVTTSFVMSARPSVRMEQLCSQWTNFDEICCFAFFQYSVEKIQVSLKLDKNKGHFV
jgi:hypothetical protein